MESRIALNQVLLAVGCTFSVLFATNASARDQDSPAGEPAARTFYVDAESGQDSHDGLLPERAWRSLARVNAAVLKPGDMVRFKCGGVWRGTLVPVSGASGKPVTYTSFGNGPKPRILGSVPRNKIEDWVSIRENIWATRPMEYQLGRSIADLTGSPWTHHQEGGARVKVTREEDQGGSFVRIAVEHSGSATNHVQLWSPKLSVTKGDCLVLTLRARSSKPFRLPSIAVRQGSPPWTQYAASNAPSGVIGTDWETHQVALDVTESADAGGLHLALGELLPEGAVVDLQFQNLHVATPNMTDPLKVDVGNLIFDDGAVCGWKKWSLDELSKPYDYYYDAASQRVFLYLDVAPPARHRSIELALARHIVEQGGKHDVVYDGLTLMYGAAHGFGGGNTDHLVIRNCDLGFIGGAHQFTTEDGHPVRFGNAIEFWGAAHDNLVEGCRIWEVYDAALTNQGNGPDSKEINIIYRNNVIWNSEYSFEYWNNPKTAVTQNIQFVHNTCVRAGRGWAHAQRPDPNGSHLMFYSNTADTSGIVVKYNIFYDHTDWGSRYSSGWNVLPDMDSNLWFSETGIMAYWFREKLAGFDEYREKSGLDKRSLFADPKFVDAAHNDFRLRPDSPARTLIPTEGTVGADMK